MFFFFVIFQQLEMKKKKRKKMLVQNLEMGYCPNCVVTKGLGSWALDAGRRRAWHGAGRAGGGAQGCGARCVGAQSVGGRPGGRAGSARRAAGTRGVRGTGAGRAAWACYWPAGCALGALNLLLTRFDSVLLLSQFLDIVREPGS